MKKLLIVFLLCCTAAHAEWYRVISVTAYNTVRASRADGDKEPIVIRIRNLEKIEFIQPDPEKVLLGGQEALALATNILQGRIVWVENLQAEEGDYAADVYPSYESVVTAYRQSRIVNGDNLTPEIKQKVRIIYTQMLEDLKQTALTKEARTEAEQTAAQVQSKLLDLYNRILSDIRLTQPKIRTGALKDEPINSYESDYHRSLFIMDAIVWFREEGQFMRPAAQQLFVDLLQSFPNQSGSDARDTQVKIETMINKESFFKELFLNRADFERGKFTYTCLDWFKNRGQYLPAEVQDLFITWLRSYQQTSSVDNEFMQQRLQWMIENNDLYLDFLDLGE
jgi:hypothetical protein